MRSQYRLALEELFTSRETCTDGRGGSAPLPSRPRLVRDERPSPRHRGREDEESDATLRQLSACAQTLILALRSDAPIGGRPGVLASYVDAAHAIGVTGERLHDALELLVNEHARAVPSGISLREILGMSDPRFRAGRCPHGSASASEPVPHWCRVGPRMT